MQSYGTASELEGVEMEPLWFNVGDIVEYENYDKNI